MLVQPYFSIIYLDKFEVASLGKGRAILGATHMGSEKGVPQIIPWTQLTHHPCPYENNHFLGYTQFQRYIIFIYYQVIPTSSSGWWYTYPSEKF
jgi:hypothetical protein